MKDKSQCSNNCGNKAFLSRDRRSQTWLIHAIYPGKTGNAADISVTECEGAVVNHMGSKTGCQAIYSRDSVSPSGGLHPG